MASIPLLIADGDIPTTHLFARVLRAAHDGVETRYAKTFFGADIARPHVAERAAGGGWPSGRGRRRGPHRLSDEPPAGCRAAARIAALERLVESPDERRTLAANARADVERNFSQHVSVRRRQEIATVHAGR